MYRIRAASLCFVVVALSFAALPAHAQGPANNLTAINARLTALETAFAAEVAARTAADTTLQNNINSEAAARAAADTTLQSNVNAEAAARAAADTTLQGQIDKLNGNITAADLEGTYNFYMVATALDDGPNTIASYVVTGTMTFGAGTGQVEDTVAAGRQLTEQSPILNWLVANIGGSGLFDGSFSWVYNNGVVTINAGGDINDFTPTAGGQVMVGVQGGPFGNNQIMFVLTRQPSI